MARLDRRWTISPSELSPLAPKGWQEISRNFPGERDCLASFLALECAEVLAGKKPANLINLANKRRSCGRNMYRLWATHGLSLIEESELRVKVLTDRGTSVLLLLYRPSDLTALLSQKGAKAILGKAGYPPSADLQSALSVLQARTEGEGFPHEIGVFLGYPLKDVAGFMGLADIPFTCQGPWKIFGDPCQSLRLAETHRACRCAMSLKLDSGLNPFECLRGVLNPEENFSVPTFCTFGASGTAGEDRR